jgi:hypothetical protein
MGGGGASDYHIMEQYDIDDEDENDSDSYDLKQTVGNQRYMDVL